VEQASQVLEDEAHLLQLLIWQAVQTPLLKLKPGIQPVHAVEDVQVAQLGALHTLHEKLLEMK
jgi:hypothetical protein